MSHSFSNRGITRRSVLIGGAGSTMLVAAGAAAGAIGAAGALTAVEPAAADDLSDFEKVRSQWLSTLVGPYDLSDPVIQQYVTDSAAAAQPLWTSLNTAAGRSYLWADQDSSTVSAVQRNNIGNLRTLALALKSPGSALSENATLKADILSALDWFLANKYGPTVHSYDNWWDWQIGIPLALNDFCVLMHDDLSAAQLSTAMAAIVNYAPTPTVTGGATSTGANRNWACAIAIVRGALIEDAGTIAAAKTALADIFPYSTSGDGFYPDGGFIQHQYFAYNGGYGISLLQYLSYSMIACAGTAWAFTAPHVSEVYDWVEHNYLPWIYVGAFMDMNRGRNISRFYDNDHRSGRLTTATLVQLAAVLPAQQAQTVLSQCKGWIAGDTYLPFFTYDPAPIEQPRISSIAQGRALMSNAAIPAAAESTQTVVATSMARAVHRRPGFVFGIAMDTTAIKPYESANNENLEGWYTGEGAVYLYLPGKLGHWPNEYWPTANKYRIPGTTIDTKTLTLGTGRGSTNTWAGGAVLDGNAAVGMGLAFAKQTLTGKKSWLCIGDTIVCLGAGISSVDGDVIESVIEQRNIGPNGQTVPVIDGAAALGTPSSTPSTFTPRWAWIPDTSGYVFPAGSTVSAVREDRSGRWTDMDHRGVYDDTTLYSRRFITLWFDHGVSPSNADYAYLQLPGATQAQTAGVAAETDLGILANTALVQAASRDGVTMANFWSATAPQVDGITVDAPVSVVVSRTGGQLSIAVADPTQLLTGEVTVTVQGPATGVVSTDPGVTVIETASQVRIGVALGGAAGKTFVARFSQS
jgi:hyaluronate lyase